MGNTTERLKPSIGIIGMACVYPGAHSPEELWQNVLAGRRFFRRMPPQRLPIRDYFDADPEAPGKTYCDQMAVIKDWAFDPLEFRIPQVTVEASDITHWLALSTAAEAIKDAHLDLGSVNLTRVGVVLGNTLTGEFSRSHYLRFRWPYVERTIRRALNDKGYEPQHIRSILQAVKYYYESPLPEITEDSLPGNMANTIVGRICNHFDFGGGGYVVDGACSSSLLAVATACNHLMNGDMDLVIAGGVDISLDPFEIVGFAKTRALASDDTRPYDDRTAGMLAGEGCGIIILAREEDARSAGYGIRALIRGWGYSSDGRSSITAPEQEGQIRALRQAYQRAGYPISCVDLIEGHGTGTALGDRVEISAILQLLAESPGDGICRIGSIKGNIGHCKAAAGTAGLIKAVMALNRKILPPTANCERPNSAFGQPLGRLRPNVRGQAWRTNNRPRRASVSAMGFGGSNCHIALEEANPEHPPCEDDLALLGTRQISELILLSAENREELATSVEKLIPIADCICQAELTDLAAALAKTHKFGKIRLAMVARSPRELAESVKRVSQRLSNKVGIEELNQPEAGIFAGIPVNSPELTALFPGQGSQRLNMGEDLLRRYPFLHELYQRAESSISDILPGGLRSRIQRPLGTADDATINAWRSELQDTRVAQPAIVLSSLCVLRVLKFLGLEPGVVIGHSLGEISALGAAGACDDSVAVRIAALRGSAMASLRLQDPGTMVALAASAAEAQELTDSLDEALVIANYNSPGQTVVSGPSKSIRKLLRVCETAGVRCRQLPVSHAFHSDIVAPASSAFSDALANVPLQPPSKTVISTSTGQEIARNTDLRDLLSEHICRPVRFTDAVLNAYKRQPALWIEVGPGNVLTGLVQNILGADRIECLATDLEGEDSFHLLNNILARAYVLGFPIAVDRLFAYRFHRTFPLDNYAPVFIVNPCERSVRSLDGLVEPTLDSRVVSEEALPDSQQNLPNSTLPPKPSIAVSRAIDSRTTDDVEFPLNLAVDWLTRRTGFPKEFITAETKLRDDLNLDSIKAVQLVLLLSQRLGREIPGNLSFLDNASLGQVVDAIINSASAELLVSGAIENGRASLQVGSLHLWVRTFYMEEMAVPLESDPRPSFPPNEFAAVIADPNCPWAPAIANRLRRSGHTPVVTDAYSLLDHGEVLDNLAAIVVILPQNDEGFLECNPTEFNDRVEGLATTLFLAFSWPVHWRKNELDDLRCLVLRPATQPEDPGDDLDAGGAFLKSLKLEYPRSHFKWVCLPTTWSADRWAEVAIRELWTSDDRTIFKYNQDGQRTTSVAIPINRLEHQDPILNAGDVVLATGGAKGITSELAFGLARLTGVKLALVGSSALPDLRSNATENEILRNLQRLDREGIRYRYVQCDVTDLKDVCQAVKIIERDLGQVTAILHGAGISNLHRFRDMSLDSCLQCIRVKARGLYNLLSAVSPDLLKALHVISSVLGKTGMRSQADYALANAWLDGALRSVSSFYPQLRCLSLGYSLWAETGMSKKLGLLIDLLPSMGLTVISVKDGVKAYLDLVRCCPQQDSTFVITGRLTPELESGLFPRSNIPSWRYLERVPKYIPGIEIVAEASLSHETDLYLSEHVFEGTPIFPGVMAIEAIVEAAMACVGSEVLPVLRNIRFHRSLIILEGTNVIIRTLALSDPAVGGVTRVQVGVRVENDGFEENYFEAECLFGLPSPDPDDLPIVPRLPERLPMDPEDLSPIPIFQGKLFRRIAAVRKLEAGTESITEVSVPEDEAYYNGQHKQITMTSSPAARDAFLQSGVIVLPAGYLPVEVREARSYLRLSPGSLLICQTRIVAKSHNSFTANIAVFTMDGQLVETVSGIMLRTPRVKPAIPPDAY